MKLEDLTEEQKAKARACETPEELVQLAMEEGVEISDDQLEEVSGGAWNTSRCPHNQGLSG